MTDMELVDELYERFRTRSQELVEMLVEHYPDFAEAISLDIEMSLIFGGNGQC